MEMEKEIKELIEKYNREYNKMSHPLSAVPTWIVIRDLQALLSKGERKLDGK